MQDKPIRSIIKAFSWRLTATSITFVISYFITKEIALAISIGAFDFFAKLLAYFGHERLWNKIKFGRKKEPEYYI